MTHDDYYNNDQVPVTSDDTSDDDSDHDDCDQVPDWIGGHGLLHDQLCPDGGACQPQLLHAGRDR